MRRTSVSEPSTPTTYALAIVALGAAVLIRYLLDPWMGDALPLVTLFAAVAAAVWIGGYRPAMLVAILGYLACDYLFIVPRGHLVFSDVGRVVGVTAYLVTVSLIIGFGEAARTAQRRANERHEVLQVTLRSIGDAVITTDTDGRITYLNAVAESLTGWTLAEARTLPLDAVFRIVNEDTRRRVDNPATKALQQGVIVGPANHTVLIQKDGRECPIDDSAAPIIDERGHVSGCVLIFRDVTPQRRMAQDKARQLLTDRLLASIIETSDDAIISKSLDGVIQSWNTAAERLFGYKADEAIGRHISLVIPPDRVAEEDHIISSLKAGQRVEHFETERLRSDGQRIFVSLTISPIKDADGQVVGASKIVRDVTERKRAEENLRRLAADLSEADRRKNEFLAMLAHELRNPLAPISNAAQALRLASSDRAAVESASKMLERQVGQMSRLVDDLLDMSRITRGKIELRREQVELAPIVEQAVEAVRAHYQSMSHELTVVLPSPPLRVNADPVRLTQVIGNLLNNACKFTDKGGHIALTVERDGGQARIRVRDNGVGVAADQLPHLFEMFVQADTSLERSRDGLGIGLTLVKTLVEMHGGSVDARSDGLGRGSEFEVRLPVLADSAQPAPVAIANEPLAAVRRRVLIVDDSEDGAESLAMLLQIGGHETHKAHDGVSAIEAAERLRPDVMLLDIGLPRLNGYEVCSRIRQTTWGKELTIVALTGWGQEEDRDRSTDAGFNAHMVKPVDHDVLMKLIASLPSLSASAPGPSGR
jgi:PAS domain S-box-containing protein